MDDIELGPLENKYVFRHLNSFTGFLYLTAIAERTDLWHAKCPPCISGE